MTGEDIELVDYDEGPRTCSKCEKQKLASMDNSKSDFAKNLTAKGGFSTICKACRKTARSTDGARERRRELYLARREREERVNLQLEVSPSGYTTEIDKSNYRNCTAIGILKVRHYENLNSLMAMEYGMTVQGLLLWQRKGCPQKMRQCTWRLNRELLQLREEMIANGDMEDAAMFLRILKQERWHVGHLA